jgi:hypothetical protein
MDKFVKYYWKHTWGLNIFITLMVLWGVIDTVRGKYSVWWMYFTLFIYLIFILGIRGELKEDYFEEKLFRQGLMS